MAQEPSDESLLRASLSDPDQFSVLVLRYEKKAYGLTRRLSGGHADAEDLSQVAWVRAFSGRAGFRAESRFSTWFYTICVNVVRDWRGRLARHPAAESLDPDKHAEGFWRGAWERLRGQMLRRDLERALRALGHEDREILVLRYFEDLDDKGVARILKIPESRVRVRVHRALGKLRRDAQEG